MHFQQMSQIIKYFDIIPQHFTWIKYSVVIDVLFGVFLAVIIFIYNFFINEESMDRNGTIKIFSYLVFIWGIYEITAINQQSINFYGIILVVAIGANFLINLTNHFNLKSHIDSQHYTWWRKLWFFKIYEKRFGYVVSYDKYDLFNAHSSRFGLHVVGSKTIWDRLLKKDGWTKPEKAAIILHEWGHSISAIFIIAVETIIFYLFFSNIQSLMSIFWLFPILFTLVTLLSWMEELIADTFSGPLGFSLMKAYMKEFRWYDYILGNIGARSHPPVILRYLAFCYVLPISVFVLLK